MKVTAVDASVNETLEALARYRYTVTRHVAEMLSEDESVDAGHDAGDHQNFPGLLASTLEALRVAEEELRAQNATLVAQRAKVDEQTRHYRELFLQLPAPTFVTDVFGTIIEANLAAERLFRRSPDHLVRTPVAAMVPTDRRDSFRRQFAHLSPSEGARDWHFAIARTGDVPLEVCATVQLVSGLGPTSSGVLYWIFTKNGNGLDDAERQQR